MPGARPGILEAGVKTFLLLLFLAAAAALGFAMFQRLSEPEALVATRERKAAPVEVADIERGAIELQRTFTGNFEASAQLVVASKISGRLTRLDADISDLVQRGAVVAEMDDAELVLAIAQAKADSAVAASNLAEAASALEIASRELERIRSLRARGSASETLFDTAVADHLSKSARVEVTRAHVLRETAALQAARVRLGYTRITAGWSGSGEQRVVAERFVDEGVTISANTPILRIVKLDPIIAVIFATERDYARLKLGQSAMLTTDAYPGVTFLGKISRIAPVFQQSSRQARIELTLENADQRLKPGMFLRATVVLAQEEAATIVPEQALTTRADRPGVFVVSADKQSVSWYAVDVGIQEGDRVQIHGAPEIGQVVVLGQQLLDDGAAISIPTPKAGHGEEGQD